MGLLSDMVVQTATAPGTGTFNLIAPVTGRSSFASQNSAGQVFYFAEDASSWEKGVGTLVVGSPDTLSRDNVLGNSLGTTAKVNFAGPVTVLCDLPAERSLWANAGGDALLALGRRLSGLAAGTDAADAVRLDQVGWQQIGSRITIGNTAGYPVGTVNVAFRFPLGFTRIMAEFDDVQPVNPGGFVICRTSADGTNYYQGAQDYMQQSLQITAATVSPSQGDYPQITVTPALNPAATSPPATASATIVMRTWGDHSYDLRSRAVITGAWWSQMSNGRVRGGKDTDMVGILFGMTSGGFSSGTFRLCGGT